MGTSSPPVPTDTHATEEFTGFLDLSRPIPHACPPIPGTTLGTAGFPDHNLVTIGTTRGDLFLTTDGVDCVSTNTDDGVWHAMGGTGIFRGATGGGTVHTEAGLGTGTAVDPIPSASTYTGSLTLS
jgi:hypothetical protein